MSELAPGSSPIPPIPPEALLTRSMLLSVMESSGLEPRRTLGQNFVVDPNTIRRIVERSGVRPGDRVFEIGPGLGSLTRGLIAVGTRPVVVEIDAQLVPILRATLGDAAEVVQGDALAVDWSHVLGGEPGWVGVANLPYNVATAVVIRLAEEVPVVQRLLVMVQREVGERWVATPGSKVYGIPSVLLARHMAARLAGGVSPEVFHPKPRVDSVLVELIRRDRPVETASPKAFGDLVRAAFQQRRKMLRRSLAGRVDADGFGAVGLSGDERPEMLDVETWCRLATCVAAPSAPGGTVSA